jgi:hypothetical protein
LVLVDVSEVVVGVAVAGVYLNGFFVPICGLGDVVPAFVDNCHVVVSAKILRVFLNAHLIVFDGVIVLFHFIIGDANRIIEFINLFA